MRRLLVIPLAPALVALLAMTALSACGDRDDTSTTKTQSTAENSGAEDASSPSTATPTRSTPTQSTSASPILEDGRHPVYLTNIDTSAASVTFDLIQFLTGDEAKRRYIEDHPEDPSGPPNDYYIVNDNQRLRTLSVVPGVGITVIWLESDSLDTEPITFDKLPDYFAGHPAPDDPYLWFDPFWLTVENGRVLAMDEQYIP